MGSSHRWPQPPSVLLVEDEPDVREAFALTLEDEGLRVLVAGSAEEGLALLQRESIDLVVTDFSLPGENGGWLLKEAHRLGVLRGDPLIVTAHSREAIGSGFTVLQKPVELQEFVGAILGRLGAQPLMAGGTAQILFALDADVVERLTLEQREQSIEIARRAAEELTALALPGVYRRSEAGLSVLYRVDRETRALTVLEVRPAG